MGIKVFGLTNCPACRMAETYLKERNVPFDYFNLEQEMEDGSPVVDYITSRTGMMTAPQIEFPDGDFVVGFSKKKLETKVASL